MISQRNSVESFCLATGKTIDEKLVDVSSGLNYKRKNFLRLMEMVESNEVSEIVIAHKDRLVRFGFEWFEKFCRNHGVTLTVMNAEFLSPEEEMTKDLLSIIHDEIRNEMVKKGYQSRYGLQARHWKLALEDVVGTWDKYWQALFTQVRSKISQNK